MSTKNHYFSVVRYAFNQKSTLSICYLDGSFFCYGMEPESVEGAVVFGARDLIPNGTYRLKLSMSKKFSKLLPEVLGVPFNSGIRIHAGNFPADTSGCLLIGRGIERSALANSSVMVENLIMSMRIFEMRNEPVFIVYSSLTVGEWCAEK